MKLLRYEYQPSHNDNEQILLLCNKSNTESAPEPSKEERAKSK